MAVFRFSCRAEADLVSIGAYTLHTWGEDQAARYIDDLEVCGRMLAESPALGRSCDEVRPGLRRMEHGPHVVFYREDNRGILISRVLHRRMLPERNDIDYDDDRGSAT